MRRVVVTVVAIWLVSALAMCGGSFSLNDESANRLDASTSDPDADTGDATSPSDGTSPLDAVDAPADDRSEPRDSAGPRDASEDRGKVDDGGEVDSGGGLDDGSLHDGGEVHDASDAGDLQDGSDLHDSSAPHDAGLHDASAADAKAVSTVTCPLQCNPSDGGIDIGGFAICIPADVTCPPTASPTIGK